MSKEFHPFVSIEDNQSQVNTISQLEEVACFLQDLTNGADSELLKSFIEQYKALQDDNAKLKNLVTKHGICTECGEMHSHSIYEPFADCKCGTSEWYADSFTPYMKLEKKHYGLRTGIQKLIGVLPG